MEKKIYYVVYDPTHGKYNDEIYLTPGYFDESIKNFNWKKASKDGIYTVFSEDKEDAQVFKTEIDADNAVDLATYYFNDYGEVDDDADDYYNGVSHFTGYNEDGDFFYNGKKSEDPIYYIEETVEVSKLTKDMF